MRGVNRVILIGNLGKEPDLQYIEGDIPVAKFPLATTEVRKDRGGNLIPETEWHNIVLWRGLAELSSKYLHKGSLVCIEGRLHTRSWEDKDKKKRFQTEIIVENLVMLDKKRDFESNERTDAFPNENKDNVISPDTFNDMDDILPF